jgi:probable rRNA maturation factor
MTAEPPAKVVADILVEAGDWPSKKSLARLVDRSVAATLARTTRPLLAGAELSVVFTDDAHIGRLNRQFLGKDSATNVLSFPAPKAAGGGFGPALGDIVLARETIEKEAESAGLTVEAHLTHLIVHGFLHLLSYDHGHDADAAIMEGLETAILAGLGIADPYADD